MPSTTSEVYGTIYLFVGGAILVIDFVRSHAMGNHHNHLTVDAMKCDLLLPIVLLNVTIVEQWVPEKCHCPVYSLIVRRICLGKMYTRKYNTAFSGMVPSVPQLIDFLYQWVPENADCQKYLRFNNLYKFSR